VLTFCLLVYLLAFPFVVGKHLKEHGDLTDPVTKHKYGSFYRSLRISDGKLVLL